MNDSIRPTATQTQVDDGSTKQARAIRTRALILSVAAQHFDTDGYTDASINTILAAGNLTKGAIYFHFRSKEEIAQQLIADWTLAIDDTISDATADGSGSTAGERLAAIFASLAQQITADTNVRAGMKLTLESTIDNAAAFAHWVDAISDIVDPAIAAGEIPDTPIAHRLAWNMCAGTVGAAYTSGALREDIDLETRIADAVTGQLRHALAAEVPHSRPSVHLYEDRL